MKLVLGNAFYPFPSVNFGNPFINTHKAAVIIKYKTTQSTMNRKNIQKK